MRKVKQSNNALQSFIKQTIKNFQTMKKKLKKIWLPCAAILTLASCGTTKVSVSKPAEGTSTTITVTTNNPVQTNVDPTIELKKGE